jgi:deazaflavin-dependent oxidoreductase (nitroreductase family)
MLRKIGQPAPPTGFKLKLFRAPLYLYKLGLGFLFGERFIRLKHWGRISGELKETVIEVIDQDKSARKLFSASGFGKKSQWYKNIVADNNVFVTLKNTEYRAIARTVELDQAKEILLRYARSHPKAIKGVARLSCYEMDGSESDIVEFSGIIRIIEFSLGEKA